MGSSKHVDPMTYSYARIDIKYKGKKKPHVKFSYPGEFVNYKTTLLSHSFLIATFFTLFTMFYLEALAIEVNPLELLGALALYCLWFTGWTFLILKKKFPILCVEFSQKVLGEEHYKRVWKKVPKEKYVEIPYFNNLFMDYEAKGEFSKYLERIKIEEHPFSKVTYKRKKEISKGNEELWRCRFYFSKIPKTGELEARWR